MQNYTAILDEAYGSETRLLRGAAHLSQQIRKDPATSFNEFGMEEDLDMIKTQIRFLARKEYSERRFACEGARLFVAD